MLTHGMTNPVLHRNLARKLVNSSQTQKWTVYFCKQNIRGTLIHRPTDKQKNRQRKAGGLSIYISDVNTNCQVATLSYFHTVLGYPIIKRKYGKIIAMTLWYILMAYGRKNKDWLKCRKGNIEHLQDIDILPVHERPSPENPEWHSQVNPPGISMHVASASQSLLVEDKHSLTSVGKIRSEHSFIYLVEINT